MALANACDTSLLRNLANCLMSVLNCANIIPSFLYCRVKKLIVNNILGFLFLHTQCIIFCFVLTFIVRRRPLIRQSVRDRVDKRALTVMYSQTTKNRKLIEGETRMTFAAKSKTNLSCSHDYF